MSYVYRQLAPASTVEKCLAVKLGLDGVDCLVTSSASRLEIFKVLPTQKADGKAASSLELLRSFELFGTIKSIAPVTFTGPAANAIGPVDTVTVLLLGFSEAKFSILHFDTMSWTLQTLSMLNFEPSATGPGAKVKAVPSGQLLYVGYGSLVPIAVDSTSTCAVSVIYDDQIIIMPFKRAQMGAVEDMEGKEDTADDLLQPESLAEETLKTRALMHAPYLLTLRDLDCGRTLQDMTFLEGYLEPTLCLLVDTAYSAVSRIAYSNHTYAIAVVSLDLAHRRHPTIWEVKGLPVNCQRLLPVPQPIGGVLVFSSNAILYFNQHNRCGLGVNGYAQVTVDPAVCTLQYPPAEDDICITLDGCRAVFISPTQVLVSLKESDIYMVELVFEDNAVRGLLLRSTGVKSLVPTSMALLPRNSVFQGSTTSDSFLLGFNVETREAEDAVEAIIAAGEKLTRKRQRTLAVDDVIPGNLDSEDLYLFGATIPDYYALQNQSQSGAAASNLAKSGSIIVDFQILTVLPNAGPMVDCALGEIKPIDPSNPEVGYEIMCASGHQGAGRLCSIVRGIKPIVNAKRALTGSSAACTGVWSICGPHKETRYVLVSHEDSTFILDAGATGLQTHVSTGDDFIASLKTLGAGSLLEGRLAVQVTHRAVIAVVVGSHSALHLSTTPPVGSGGLGVRDGETICAVSFCDPYILIRLSSGTCRLVEALHDPASDTPYSFEVTLPQAVMTEANPAVHASLCAVQHPELVSWLRNNAVPELVARSLATLNKPPTAGLTSIDEEDAALYGDARMDGADVASTETKTEDLLDDEAADDGSSVTALCVVARQNGTLVIYGLPDWTLLFETMGVHQAPMTLERRAGRPEAVPSAAATSTFVADAELVFLPHPHLLLVMGTELFVYKLRAPSSAAGLGFVRLDNDTVTANPLRKGVKETDASAWKSWHQKLIFPFAEVCGWSGAFVRATTNAWVLPRHRSAHVLPAQLPHQPSVPLINLDPTSRDVHTTGESGVRAFAPLLLEGVSLCAMVVGTTMYLVEIPAMADVSLQGSCVMRKVAVDGTPTAVTYLTRASVIRSVINPLYAVCINRDVDMDPEADLALERKEAEELEQTEPPIRHIELFEPAAPMQPVLREVRVELRLIEGGTCQTIFTERFPPFERVMCIEEMELAENVGASKELCLAIGTGNVFPAGESNFAKGRLLLYKIRQINAADAHGNIVSKPELKQVIELEQKGAVTAIRQLRRYVLMAAGMKMFLYMFTGERLEPVAFYDAQVMITGMNVMKDYVFFGDILQSVHMLQWQEREMLLVLLARDLRPNKITTTGVTVHESSLGMVAADVDGNIQVFRYNPNVYGTSLQVSADFFVGSIVTNLVPYRFKRVASEQSPRIGCLVTCASGSLGLLVPVPESTYKRLVTLQALMTQALPHDAGLNPRAFRAFHASFKRHRASTRTVADGVLLWQYLQLDPITRRDFAKYFGSSQEKILSNLAEIDNMTWVV